MKPAQIGEILLLTIIIIFIIIGEIQTAKYICILFMGYITGLIAGFLSL